MQYSEVRPHPRLANFVKCYWALSGDAVGYECESVSPDGSVELVLNLADPFRRYSDSKNELQPSTLIVGQMTQAVLIQPTGCIDILGVRFQPYGFYRFVQQPISEFTDSILDCRDIWGRDIGRLRERLYEAPVIQQRITILESFLFEFLDDPRSTTKSFEHVKAAVLQLKSNKGQLRVEQLAERLQMSARHLERQFKLIVGLRPKTFGRIIRFQNALGMIGNRRADTACIAADCGYYDQAHLINDFKRFSHQAPAAYCADEHLLSRHFVESERLSDFSNTRVAVTP